MIWTPPSKLTEQERTQGPYGSYVGANYLETVIKHMRSDFGIGVRRVDIDIQSAYGKSVEAVVRRTTLNRLASVSSDSLTHTRTH